MGDSVTLTITPRKLFTRVGVVAEDFSLGVLVVGSFSEESCPQIVVSRGIVFCVSEVLVAYNVGFVGAKQNVNTHVLDFHAGQDVR